jgi:hypothetical protein
MGRISKVARVKVRDLEPRGIEYTLGVACAKSGRAYDELRNRTFKLIVGLR